MGRGLGWFTSALVGVACVLMLGCDAEEGEGPSSAAPSSARAELAEPDVEAEPDAEPASEDGDDAGGELVIEVSTTGDDDGPRSSSALTPQSLVVEAEPLALPWRERGRVEADVELLPLASGVLARSDAGYFEGDSERGLVERPEIELPANGVDGLIGRWPGDVWLTTQTPSEAGDRVELSFVHRSRKGEWVPGRHKYRDRWSGEDLGAAKSWRGGMLVRRGSTLIPVGGRKRTMKIGPRMGKQVVEVFESRSGTVYSISERSGAYYAQRRCMDFPCVQDEARRLPHGTQWRFGAQAPRHQHGLSILADVMLEGNTAHHIFHCGVHGWTLESLVERPLGLWASEAGELWLSVASVDGPSSRQLWVRDGDERWHAVALPAEVERFSVAYVEDGDELWIAARQGEHSVVYSTPASPEIED